MANNRGQQYERDGRYDDGGRRGMRGANDMDRERERENEREWFDRRESFQSDEPAFSDEERSQRGLRGRGFGDERYGRSERGRGMTGERGRGAESWRGGESWQGDRDRQREQEYRGSENASYGRGERDHEEGRGRSERQGYGGGYQRDHAGGRPSWETESDSPGGAWSPYNEARQPSLAQQTRGQSGGDPRYDRSGYESERVTYGTNRHQGYVGQGQGAASPSPLRRIPEHIGKGPKGYTRTDERIQEEVHERLASGYLDASDVEVTVKNGEVVLKGTVHSKADRRIAEDAIDDVVGVKEVDNRLKVKRPESGASTAALSSSSSARGESDRSEKDEAALRGSSGQTGKRS